MPCWPISFSLLVVLLFIFSLVVFVVSSRNLLFSLILLELVSFLSLSCVVISLVRFSGSDYIVFLLFSIFVIEGVVGVSGLISLVRFSGSDYIVSNSFTKC